MHSLFLTNGIIYSDSREESKLLESVNAYKFRAKEIFPEELLLCVNTQLPILYTFYTCMQLELFLPAFICQFRL